MKRLIELVKVMFEDNAQISLAPTNLRHHKVTKDMPAIKWGFSYSTVKVTLDATTNM